MTAKTDDSEAARRYSCCWQQSVDQHSMQDMRKFVYEGIAAASVLRYSGVRCARGSPCARATEPVATLHDTWRDEHAMTAGSYHSVCSICGLRWLCCHNAPGAATFAPSADTKYCLQHADCNFYEAPGAKLDKFLRSGRTGPFCQRRRSPRHTFAHPRARFATAYFPPGVLRCRSMLLLKYPRFGSKFRSNVSPGCTSRLLKVPDRFFRPGFCNRELST
jgi:hypothetical protein